MPAILAPQLSPRGALEELGGQINMKAAIMDGLNASMACIIGNPAIALHTVVLLTCVTQSYYFGAD